MPVENFKFQTLDEDIFVGAERKQTYSQESYQMICCMVCLANFDQDNMFDGIKSLWLGRLALPKTEGQLSIYRQVKLFS